MGIVASPLCVGPGELRSGRAHGHLAAIAGCGVYLPECVLTNRKLERMVETSDRWISGQGGIQERRLVEPGTPTFELAVWMASNAIGNSDLGGRVGLWPSCGVGY
jgi:hypothetical protein